MGGVIFDPQPPLKSDIIYACSLIGYVFNFKLIVEDIFGPVKGKSEVRIRIQHDPNGAVGFVFLNGPLNDTQSQAVDKALIQHHLHFTKQIIRLLNLTPEDLEISANSSYMTKVMFYLFGGSYFYVRKKNVFRKNTK